MAINGYFLFAFVNNDNSNLTLPIFV